MTNLSLILANEFEKFLCRCQLLQMGLEIDQNSRDSRKPCHLWFSLLDMKVTQKQLSETVLKN